jgi:hypothetical protein
MAIEPSPTPARVKKSRRALRCGHRCGRGDIRRISLTVRQAVFPAVSTVATSHEGRKRGTIRFTGRKCTTTASGVSTSFRGHLATFVDASTHERFE